MTFMVLTSQIGQAYQGSSFNDILAVLRSEKIPEPLSTEVLSELDVYKNYRLPLYLPLVSETIIEDANRTLSDRVDWYDRLVKRIHGNGICFSGIWQIDQNSKNPYTGYFSQGSRGLFVGRVSTTTHKVLGGSPRTFGFAGKIFPTLNPEEIVATENFFTVDALLGSRVPKFSEVVLSNRPVVFSGFTGTDWSFVLAARNVDKLFEKADRNSKERTVLNVAKMNNQSDPVAPHIINIKVNPNTPTADYMDFRHELDFLFLPQPQLILDIFAGQTKKDLEPIGKIILDESYSSYGCDRQLHFAHPKEEPKEAQ